MINAALSAELGKTSLSEQADDFRLAGGKGFEPGSDGGGQIDRRHETGGAFAADDLAPLLPAADFFVRDDNGFDGLFQAHFTQPESDAVRPAEIAHCHFFAFEIVE